MACGINRKFTQSLPLNFLLTFNNQGDPMSFRTNRPKSSPTPFFSTLIAYSFRGKSCQKMFGYFWKSQKAAKSKQSHNSRKFAQSGHPGTYVSRVKYLAERYRDQSTQTSQECTYICTYIHTYIHTYICTYIHTYIHMYICTYIPMYIHTYICTYIHMYIHTYVHT
jgi:hypothetical protein